jgi:S-adenosylmethionine-dependent methyltransferase
MAGIADYYDKNRQREWERLERRHRTEFALTMRSLAEHLPPSPVDILDIGGGPCRYAIALAKIGHRVTLLDPSTECLDLARQKATEERVQLAAIESGDARDLSRFQGESFDAALLMGPLYHLVEEADRQATLREARRVLRPRGLVFAAFLTRYAPIRKMAKESPEWPLKEPDRFARILEQGVVLATDREKGFPDSYFAHPTEVKPFMEAGGFETLDLLACEGVVSMIEEKLNKSSPEAFEVWVEVNYRLGRDLCTHGGAEHLLYVGRLRA